MLNDDLEIARKLLHGGWRPPRRRRPAQQSVMPAVFREIDGGELARQYATRREIEAASSLGRPSREDRMRARKAEQNNAGGLLDWARGLRWRFSTE